MQRSQVCAIIPGSESHGFVPRDYIYDDYSGDMNLDHVSEHHVG